MSYRKNSWSIKCDYYVAVAMQTIKYLLSEDNIELKSGNRPRKVSLPHGYKPDLDVTYECDAKHMSWFKQLIEILRWAFELLRIYVQIEVVLLLQYQAPPQEGHLEALYLIFHFLSKNPNNILLMDPSVQDFD